MNRWKHYLPAGLACGLALLFLKVPGLAVFILFSGLMVFGIAYAYIVYRIHHAQDRQWQQGVTIEPDVERDTDPGNFKNVTVHVFRKSGFDKISGWDSV